MHTHLNDDAANYVSGGAQTSSLAGTITTTGLPFSMVCCTQNVGASSATVNVSSQPGNNISWSGGGTGNFNSNANGHILNISNLGSVNLAADWNENCKDFRQTWTFFNGGSFFTLSPNPSSAVLNIEVKNTEEWISIAAPGSTETKSHKPFLDSWTIKSESGYIMKSGNIKSAAKSFQIDISDLKAGIYYTTLEKGKQSHNIPLIKN